MRRTILNKQDTPKAQRFALILITLLLLPSTALAARYTTTGNVVQGTGNNVFNWTINSGSEWKWIIQKGESFPQIKKVGDSNRIYYVTFQTQAANVTLTPAKDISASVT